MADSGKVELEVVDEIPPEKHEGKGGLPPEKGAIVTADDVPSFIEQAGAHAEKVKAEGGTHVEFPIVKGQGEAQNRPAAYWEGDKLVIRASSFGSCFGALVRHANGITGEMPPDFMLEKFAEGHENEPIILGQVNLMDGYTLFDDWDLEDEFGELHDGQARLEIPVGDRIIIRQHFDQFAKIIGDASGIEYGYAPVEAKALAPSSVKAYKRLGLGFLPNYPWQVAIAGYAVGQHIMENDPGEGTVHEMKGAPTPFCPVIVAVGEKDEDGVVQDGKVKVDVIDVPPFTLGQIKMRAMEILAKVEAGGIPECDWAQFPCPFWQDGAHKRGVWEKKKPITAEEAGIDGEMLVKIASDHAAGRAMEKRGKELKDENKVLLAELMEGRLDTRVSHGGVVVVPKGTGMKQGGIDWEKAARAKGVTDEEAEKYRKPDYPSGLWFDVQEEKSDA